MLVNFRALLKRAKTRLATTVAILSIPLAMSSITRERCAARATDTGASPSGKAAGFDPAMRWFKSSRPCHLHDSSTCHSAARRHTYKYLPPFDTWFLTFCHACRFVIGQREARPALWAGIQSPRCRASANRARGSPRSAIWAASV